MSETLNFTKPCIAGLGEQEPLQRVGSEAVCLLVLTKAI